MNSRYEEWCGATHYYTRFKNGIHEVVEDRGEDLEPVVVYVGHYKKCVEWIKNKYKESCITW